MAFLTYNLWIDKFIELSRHQLNERKAFYSNEARQRSELKKQYQAEKKIFTNPLDEAILLQRYINQLATLSWNKEERFEQLKRSQAEELYDLLLIKLIS